MDSGLDGVGSVGNSTAPGREAVEFVGQESGEGGPSATGEDLPTITDGSESDVGEVALSPSLADSVGNWQEQGDEAGCELQELRRQPI